MDVNKARHITCSITNSSYSWIKVYFFKKIDSESHAESHYFNERYADEKPWAFVTAKSP